MSESLASADEKRRVRRGVVIAYGVVAVLGAAFFALSFQYDFFKQGDLVGPGFLPRIAGAVLAVLGLLLVMQEVRTGSTLAGDSGIDETQAPMDRKTALKIVLVFGLITATLLLSPVLGMIPSLYLLILALTLAVERMPVIPSLIICTAAAVVGYVLFVIVLRVPIPMGIFGGIL